MSDTPRRRVLRPARSSPAPVAREQHRRQKWREQLAREQVSLARTMSRLKRVFHAFEKQQQRIARLKRRLNNGPAR